MEGSYMKKVLLLILIAVFVAATTQVFAGTISGQIDYSGSRTGTVYVIYTQASGPGPACTLEDWNAATRQMVPGVPPVTYNLTVPDGTYCIAAYLDTSPAGYPPGFNDPIGFHG
jgi:hypothetical protein